jgi:hypothetical protein
MSTLGISADHTKLIERHYARWARLADQQENVSKFVYTIHDGNADNERSGLQRLKSERPGLHNVSFDSVRLIKVVPTYAYRNRRMTQKDLYHEMMGASVKWEDFRGLPSRDRDEERIGSLHVEVLECHGLVRHSMRSPLAYPPSSSPRILFTDRTPPHTTNAAQAGPVLTDRRGLLHRVWALRVHVRHY